MSQIIWRAGLFDGTNREESEDTILKLLAVLVDRDCQYLRAHPDTPKLYDSGVVYALPDQMTHAPDPAKLARLNRYLANDMSYDEETIDIVDTVLHGCEIFRDIPAIIKKKKVDCDNFSCWRSAELRVGDPNLPNSSVEAVPYIIWRETPHGTTYHALVRHPDGTSEDPSILLGMGGEAKAAERAEERRKNRERYGNLIAAGHQLVQNGADPREIGRRIDALGFLPKDKSW